MATIFSNLLWNVENRIGNNNISDAVFEKQINRLTVQSFNTKKPILIPSIDTKIESGTTQIIIQPLAPVNAIDLCNVLNQAKGYLEHIDTNFANVNLLQIDASDNKISIYLDKEIDLNDVKAQEQFNEDTFGVKIDLFDFDSNLFEPENNGANYSVEKGEELSNKELTQAISQELKKDIQPTNNNALESQSNTTLSNELEVENSTRISTEEMVMDEKEKYGNERLVITQNEIKKESFSNTDGFPSNDNPITENEVFTKTDECNTKETLMLIDGNNLLIRGYYATAHFVEDENDLLKDQEGNFINALKLFVQQLERLLKTYSPDYLCVAFDNNNPFLETLRKRFYPAYKATRDEKPAALIQQLDAIIDVLVQMNIPFIMDPKGLYEADDLIGSLIKKWRNQNNGTIYIVSNDKDLYQLLNDPNTFQIIKKGSEEVVYSKKDFESDYGILTSQWADVKAILGDKSDNILGVSGVGEKFVYDILKEYQSVENLYENLNRLLENHNFKRYLPKFKSQQKEAMLSKYLATIITNVPIEEVQQLDIKNLILNVNVEGKQTVYVRMGLIREELK
ncbi:5'-3' exonuclease [Ureibacillus thermosphaericus]|uniref:5'-3' exonuclease n=1 Tax=Ureibacillus thermosphaericus TaxID=51173 RepID=UPI000369A2A6|nr:5'-3' exonuclease [Ureibacillus thermosphaericus]